MSGKFISLILAASLAVAGMTATPAAASDRDMARALAAIAGIAIIGVAISDNNKSKRRDTPYVSSRGHGPKVHHSHRQKKMQRHHRRQMQKHRAHRRQVQKHRAHRSGHGHNRGYSARRH